MLFIPRGERYSKMTSEPIFNPEVLELWKHWILERNRIYIRKEIDQKPFPWTEDPILREFRFTNVKRWQDKESKWLIENICNNPSLSYEDKLYNCILFRTWNKSKTFEIVCGKGMTVASLLNTPIEEFQKRIEDYQKYNPDYVWFTNAFNTGGIKQSWRYSGKTSHQKESVEDYEDPITPIPLRMIYFIRAAIENKIAQRVMQCSHPKQVYRALLRLKGLAKFLAYQIFIDFTYIKDFPFDENSFVVSGPGCKKGLEYLFENRKGLSLDEALFYLRDHQDELFPNGVLEREFSYLPEENRRLTVMDIENSMCELFKYCKVYFGEGRPRNKYHIQ